MKEHRTKALRVTTTSSIQSKDEPDLFGGLQLLQLELSTGACVVDQWTTCKSKPQTTISTNLITTDSEEDNYGGRTSGLLQECMSCRSMFMGDLYITPSVNKMQQKEKVVHCLCPKPGMLCSTNCFNLTPLYSILTGNLDSWPLVLDEVRKVVSSEAKECDWLNWTDSEGNNALLIGGQRLLNEGSYGHAADLVNVLVEAGCDPNVKNIEGRSLLSYSVQHMDDSLPLTRLLLNSGASVWPSGTNSTGPSSEENGCSVFTWFLRGVMRRRRLDSGCQQTLSLLAQVMGECPHKMHAHVMRTMFKHAKCYRVLGPVFLQMKLAMASYWAQPQELQFLCRRIIRHNLLNNYKSHKNKTKALNLDTVSKLGLPPKVQSYIMLQ